MLLILKKIICNFCRLSLLSLTLVYSDPDIFEVYFLTHDEPLGSCSFSFSSLFFYFLSIFLAFILLFSLLHFVASFFLITYFPSKQHDRGKPCDVGGILAPLIEVMITELCTFIFKKRINFHIGNISDI